MLTDMSSLLASLFKKHEREPNIPVYSSDYQPEVDYLVNVGKISFSSNRIHWIIPNFYELSQKAYTIIVSPRFLFKNINWRISAYPNGCLWDASIGWFGISVENWDQSEEFIVHLGIQQNFVNTRAEHFEDGKYLLSRIIRRSVLESKKRQMVPGGDLHLIFAIGTETPDDALDSATQEHTEAEEEIADAGENSVTEEKSGEKEIAEAEVNLVAERNSRDIKSLQYDLKELLVSENVSDVTLKMRDREFKAHRMVLAARSPVLLTMMTRDTKENTGVVDIEDSNPDTFLDFLHYLYTGSLERLTVENAAGLYVAADTYETHELKDACLKFMMGNISVGNFCDVLPLSLRYDEAGLREACIDFFGENTIEIVMTLKWQEFLTENPIIGNELYIKKLRKREPVIP